MITYTYRMTFTALQWDHDGDPLLWLPNIIDPWIQTQERYIESVYKTFSIENLNWNLWSHIFFYNGSLSKYGNMLQLYVLRAWKLKLVEFIVQYFFLSQGHRSAYHDYKKLLSNSISSKNCFTNIKSTHFLTQDKYVIVRPSFTMRISSFISFFSEKLCRV